MHDQLVQLIDCDLDSAKAAVINVDASTRFVRSTTMVIDGVEVTLSISVSLVFAEPGELALVTPSATPTRTRRKRSPTAVLMPNEGT